MPQKFIRYSKNDMSVFTTNRFFSHSQSSILSIFNTTSIIKSRLPQLIILLTSSKTTGLTRVS